MCALSPRQVDEFQSIAELFRPLTNGAPEALGLIDDAALVPSRPGFDLIITKDAIVEGVHFLAQDPPGMVAQKLLRVNLSDLAAKAAEPYGYFLAAAWPKAWDAPRRAAFAEGLRIDQTAFGITLFGGDTVATPGPLTLSATLLGWSPVGRMVKRSTATVDDVVMVSGTVGDGWLGLAAAKGGIQGMSDQALACLSKRYRLPEPRLALREMLRAYATAAADVSDGLFADLAHIGEASSLGVELDLDRVPLSSATNQWLEMQPDRAGALKSLVTGGDDYEIVCTVKPEHVDQAIADAGRSNVALTPIGRMTVEPRAKATFKGRQVEIVQRGWTHA